MALADKPLLPIRQLIRRTVLAALPATGLDELCAAVTVERYRDQTLLSCSAQPRDCIWLVVEGQIEIVDREAVGPEGLLGAIGPGRWFSWLGLFMRTPHLQDHLAAERTLLLCVEGPAMREILARHPAIYPLLMAEVGERVQLIMQLLGQSIVGDPTRRLAVLLITMASIQIGIAAPPNLNTSHARLAQMLGVSRQLIGKSLETLEQHGLVRRAYGTIELLDLPGLRAFLTRPLV